MRQAFEQPMAARSGLRAPRSGDDVGETLDDPAETAFFGQLVAMAVRTLHATSVLDIGCGTGVATLNAARAGATRVVGIDISPKNVERARHNARCSGRGAQVAFHCASWEEVCRGHLSRAPDLLVSNPPYVPAGSGPAVDGGPLETSLLLEIVRSIPSAVRGIALVFGSFSDPLTVLSQIEASGFAIERLQMGSVRFGRYTSAPSTLARLHALRAAGRAWFYDTPALGGTAPHAYLTLGLLARRRSESERLISERRELTSEIAALLTAYQSEGPRAVARKLAGRSGATRQRFEQVVM